MSDDTPASGQVKLGKYTLPLPRSRILRIVIGVFLIIGGFLSILPVFGLWMIPLGLLVLSVDIPRVRRWRRRFAVWFARRFPKLAEKLHMKGTNGNGNGGNGAANPSEAAREK